MEFVGEEWRGGQRAEGGEQRAEGKEQGAESGGQGVIYDLTIYY